VFATPILRRCVPETVPIDRVSSYST